MKKITTCMIVFAAICIFGFPLAGAEYKSEVIDSIKITGADIPSGFQFGTVPAFARNVLKDNPWKMDKGAIKKLAPQIYPSGDPGVIADMYVAILARTSQPTGDDIVCYIILYTSASTARDEVKKLTSFSEVNRDRTIVITNDNMAVYLLVDDTENLPLIRDLATRIREKLKLG
ncbi:MAG: hypothetical protein EPN93_07390 [Spirochaetes bacterium]|nr:MAG: hypothetical protein EPN93_07390 [Spirochaetota bacterium]